MESMNRMKKSKSIAYLISKVVKSLHGYKNPQTFFNKRKAAFRTHKKTGTGPVLSKKIDIQSVNFFNHLS